MDCLICNKVHFDPDLTIDIFSSTFCKLIDIQLTTFAWNFNSSTICPACSAKLKQIHGLYNQLEVLKVRLDHYRKEIIEDLVKSQEATEAAGNELEERTKIIQEIRSKVYDEPNYDGPHPDSIQSQDLDFFGPLIPITMKNAQIVLERIELPAKSMDIHDRMKTKNTYNITQEPIASFIKRDQLKFNLKKASKSKKTRTRNIKKSMTRRGRPRKMHPSPPGRKALLIKNDKSAKGKYICSDCGQGFRNPSFLIDHQRKHTGELPFQCEVCNKRLRSKKQLDSHQFIHGIGKSAVQCSICGLYMKNSALKVHMDRHKGLRNHLCDMCPLSFASEASLRYHRLSIHMGLKLNCPHCEQVFNRKQGLQEHIQKYHEKKLDVLCPDCNKAFINKSRMLTHRRSVHMKGLIEERKIPCTFCDKSYGHRTRLKEHVMIHHTKELPFKCTFKGCKSRGFVNQRNLNKHLQLHSGINHICPYCAKGYAVEFSLKLHIKNSCKKNSCKKKPSKS